MRKLLILSITCLMTLCAVAQVQLREDEVTAVKFVQNETTDWYMLADNPEVTFTDHNPVISGKTYDLANGDVETEFGTAPADLWYTVRTDGAAGNWNTICLEKNITAIDGATFWTISGQDATSFILDEITEPEAGFGYLIRFTAAELKVKYGSETAATPVPASYGNPIQGTYVQIDPDGTTGESVLTGNYIIYNNELRKVGTWVGLHDHRAYVKADLVPNNAPAPVPGRSRLYMPKPKETPTGEMRIENGEMRMDGKYIINGQFVIVKDGKKYNALGF